MKALLRWCNADRFRALPASNFPQPRLIRLERSAPGSAALQFLPGRIYGLGCRGNTIKTRKDAETKCSQNPDPPVLHNHFKTAKWEQYATAEKSRAVCGDLFR